MPRTAISRVGEQAWRIGRLFTVAFVAQLELLPGGHLTRTAAVSAAVAAAEAVYRQVSPSGQATILNGLASVFGGLAAAATKSSKPAAAPVNHHVTINVAADVEQAQKAVEAAAEAVKSVQHG